MRTSMLALILLAAAGAPQAGELYRWVDPDGQVHYTDQAAPARGPQRRTQAAGRPARRWSGFLCPPAGDEELPRHGLCCQRVRGELQGGASLSESARDSLHAEGRPSGPRWLEGTDRRRHGSTGGHGRRQRAARVRRGHVEVDARCRRLPQYRSGSAASVASFAFFAVMLGREVWVRRRVKGEE